MTFIATKLFHKAGEGSGGGGGGGDQHNLGWYATESALTTAHPTASNGDWAIVGATDTVWVWDSDTTAWKDTDTKGQVTSVNGQTGAVTVDTLPSQTGQSGKFLYTDGTDASWSDKPLVNKAVSTDTIAVVRGNASINSQWSVIFNTNRNHGASSAGSIVMGYYAQSTNYYALAFGYNAVVSGYQGMAFGYSANVSGNHSIQFGNGSNSESNTMKVSFGDDSSDPNYTLLEGDGTIPEDRLADTTNAQQGDVLTLDSNGNAVWQAGGGGGGSQIQYSTMPNAEQNAGRIVQYIGSSETAPEFTITFESMADAITISDPTTFRNALDTELLTNDGVQLTVGCEIACSYNDNPVSLSIEVTGIDSNTHYVTFTGSSAIANAGVAISVGAGACTTIFSCDSLGGSAAYTNGYFYKSVSGGASGLQFVCDTTKIEIVDPALFITSVDNAMQGGTQVVDGTYFEISCNMSGGAWSIFINIQAPDGQGGVLEDSGEINTLDPETDAGLSIIAQSNYFQTYASYTSTPSEPQIYNWNPNDLTITNAQTFLDFCNNITTIGAQYTVNLEITQTGSWEVRINIADENGNQVADTMVVVQDLNTEVGISVNSNQVNASLFIISTGGATGYHWQQVNVQPITADSIAPTTGLADGNYKLQLVITDGVPVLSWVAE